jgi:biotin transport system ATP-binding protein
MEAPITLTGVSHLAQGRAVLSDLTLTLSARRIGILGRNGSGKTTLLRLIAGLEAPSTGVIRLGDLDPARDRKGVLSRLGILFQNPDHQILFPTVIEELSFGLCQMGHTRPEAEARAEAMLAAEGRSHWRDAHCHRLSQGQRQYLCLMAVLLMGPDWLLLDEPFAGLDLPTAARLRRRLAAVRAHVVMISHDPQVLEGMDHILWLDAGRLRLQGAPDEVIPPFLGAMAEEEARDADTDLA